MNVFKTFSMYALGVKIEFNVLGTESQLSHQLISTDCPTLPSPPSFSSRLIQPFTRTFRRILLSGMAWERLAQDNNPLLVRELQEFPKIHEFNIRPYLNQHWDSKTRRSIIANHYRLVAQCAPILNLAANECVELSHIGIQDNGLRVVLDKPEWFRREGEVGISLFLGIDRIYTAMFTLAGAPDDLKIMVGNVQGDGRSRTASYKTLTKTLHGMRPRDFLLTMLTLLAQALGCKEILGICDDAHRSRHFLSRAQKTSAYDQIWQEQGGQLHGDGFFHMPAKKIKRRDEDIPSNKRGVYRHRYQLLDELKASVELHVQQAPEKVHIAHLHDAYLRKVAPKSDKVRTRPMLLGGCGLCLGADLCFYFNLPFNLPPWSLLVALPV